MMTKTSIKSTGANLCYRRCLFFECKDTTIHIEAQMHLAILCFLSCWLVPHTLIYHWALGVSVTQRKWVFTDIVPSQCPKDFLPLVSNSCVFTSDPTKWPTGIRSV